MHLLTTSRPGFMDLLPGRTYLMDSQTATELSDAGDALDLCPIPYSPPIPQLPALTHLRPQTLHTLGSLPSALSSPIRILILRAGGWGDILFLTPTLKELLRRYGPRLHITVATHDHKRAALAHPDLAGIHVVPYPYLCPEHVTLSNRGIPAPSELPPSDPSGKPPSTTVNHRQPSQTDPFAPHPSILGFDAIYSGERIIHPQMRFDAATYFASEILGPRLPHNPAHWPETLTLTPSFDLKPLYHVPEDTLAQAWQDYPPAPVAQASPPDPVPQASRPVMPSTEIKHSPIPAPRPSLWKRLGKQLQTTANNCKPPPTSSTPRRVRIGIQLEASVKNRTYPVDLTAQLIEMLLKEDQCQVFTFGTPVNDQQRQRAISLPNYHALPYEDPAPTWEQSTAILATMDAFIAPDSSLCHIAGALGIPTIALYGPFHWKQRTGHMPTVRALQGHAPCAPCQWHYHKGAHFPPDQPCSKQPAQHRHCQALATITPQRIRTELWKLLEP